MIPLSGEYSFIPTYNDYIPMSYAYFLEVVDIFV